MNNQFFHMGSDFRGFPITALGIVTLSFGFSLSSQAIALAQQAGSEGRVTAAFPLDGEPPAPDLQAGVAEPDFVDTKIADSGDVDLQEEFAANLAQSTSGSDRAEGSVSNTTSSNLPETPVDATPDARHKNSEPLPLSVGPLESSLLPADRPDWIAEQPNYSGDKHYFVVNTVPFTEPGEATATLDVALLSQVRSYIDNELLNTRGAAAQIEEINVNLIRSEWLNTDRFYRATITTEQGAYLQDWTQVTIDSKGRAKIQRWWLEIVQQRRLATTGLGLVGAISIIGLGHLGVQAIGRRKKS